MSTSEVVVLKTNPETVIADYEKLLAMAQADKYLAKDKTTILKDNISWHLMFPSANTTPWQLEGTILGLQKLGYQDITSVHNQTVVTKAHVGQKENKLDKIYKKYNVAEKYNFEENDMKWVKYEPKAKMLVLDKIFPNGIRIPDYFFDKNIVHLPTVKCHIYTETTGAMKNAFGGLLSTMRHYTHSWIHETLVDLLNIQKEIHSGLFAVMDGTTAGNGAGPRTLVPVTKDYILASADQVAIDAVAAKMMGFDPMKLKYIRLAHEQGLGCGDVKDIKIVGEDITDVNFHFKTGDNMASRVGDLLWFSPLKAIQNLFFKTPLVNLFIIGSDTYHDKYWYKAKGKKVVKEWYQTKWGQLFKENY